MRINSNNWSLNVTNYIIKKIDKSNQSTEIDNKMKYQLDKKQKKSKQYKKNREFRQIIEEITKTK